MDYYTTDTKNWLENRYSLCDKDGIYISHQPLYGFRDSHCEPGHTSRYIITFHTLKLLSYLNFSSFLDVGGGEGYKSSLVKFFFNVTVTNSDISQEACKRSEEIFNISSRQADIHKLPFKDNEFDIVHCSETVEHVADKQKALSELMRCARKAVIITVPHESKKTTEKNLRNKIPHGHINNFSVDSLSYLKNGTCRVMNFKILHPAIRILSLCADALPRSNKVPGIFLKTMVGIYNLLVPIFQYVFNKRSLAALIKLDFLLSKISPMHDGIIFIILKEGVSFNSIPLKQISPEDIINFKIPYHFLKKT